MSDVFIESVNSIRTIDANRIVKGRLDRRHCDGSSTPSTVGRGPGRLRQTSFQRTPPDIQRSVERKQLTLSATGFHDDSA